MGESISSDEIKEIQIHNKYKVSGKEKNISFRLKRSNKYKYNTITNKKVSGKEKR